MPAIMPRPKNASFLWALNNADVVPKLATFNFEVNGPAATITGDVFDRMD